MNFENKRSITKTKLKPKQDILKFVVILILPHKIMINNPYDKISYFCFKFEWKST